MPVAKPKRLLTEERRRAVLDLLEKQGRVTVEELNFDRSICWARPLQVPVEVA